MAFASDTLGNKSITCSWTTCCSEKKTTTNVPFSEGHCVIEGHNLRFLLTLRFDFGRFISPFIIHLLFLSSLVSCLPIIKVTDSHCINLSSRSRIHQHGPSWKFRTWWSPNCPLPWKRNMFLPCVRASFPWFPKPFASAISFWANSQVIFFGKSWLLFLGFCGLWNTYKWFSPAKNCTSSISWCKGRKFLTYRLV